MYLILLIIKLTSCHPNFGHFAQFVQLHTLDVFGVLRKNKQWPESYCQCIQYFQKGK